LSGGADIPVCLGAGADRNVCPTDYCEVSPSNQDLGDDVAVDVGKSEVASLEAER